MLSLCKEPPKMYCIITWGKSIYLPSVRLPTVRDHPLYGCPMAAQTTEPIGRWLKHKNFIDTPVMGLFSDNTLTGAHLERATSIQRL